MSGKQERAVVLPRRSVAAALVSLLSQSLAALMPTGYQWCTSDQQLLSWLLLWEKQTHNFCLISVHSPQSPAESSFEIGLSGASPAAGKSRHHRCGSCWIKSYGLCYTGVQATWLLQQFLLALKSTSLSASVGLTCSLEAVTPVGFFLEELWHLTLPATCDFNLCYLEDYTLCTGFIETGLACILF